MVHPPSLYLPLDFSVIPLFWCWRPTPPLCWPILLLPVHILPRSSPSHNFSSTPPSSDSSLIILRSLSLFLYLYFSIVNSLVLIFLLYSSLPWIIHFRLFHSSPIFSNYSTHLFLLLYDFFWTLISLLIIQYAFSDLHCSLRLTQIYQLFSVFWSYATSSLY